MFVLVIGARLISQAGSLTNLAKYPSSTVQILGAEKALFRALKERSNTPKYGIIYNCTYIGKFDFSNVSGNRFVGRAQKKDKGRISRYVASKSSVCSRIDAFMDARTDIFGKLLRQQCEDRYSNVNCVFERSLNLDSSFWKKDVHKARTLISWLKQCKCYPKQMLKVIGAIFEKMNFCFSDAEDEDSTKMIAEPISEPSTSKKKKRKIKADGDESKPKKKKKKTERSKDEKDITKVKKKKKKDEKSSK